MELAAIRAMWSRRSRMSDETENCSPDAYLVPDATPNWLAPSMAMKTHNQTSWIHRSSLALLNLHGEISHTQCDLRRSRQDTKLIAHLKELPSNVALADRIDDTSIRSCRVVCVLPTAFIEAAVCKGRPC